MQSRRLIVWSTIYCIKKYYIHQFIQISKCTTFLVDQSYISGLHCTRKYISMLLKISYSLSRILLAIFLSHSCNKTSQCKVQHLVGHLVYIFLNYWLATVIFFQNRFISLLLPLLKDFQNASPFPAAGV